MTPSSTQDDDDPSMQSYEDMEVFTRSSGQHVSTAVSFPTVSPLLCDSASHAASLGFSLGLNTHLSLSPTLSAALASLSSTMPQLSAVTMPTTVHHLNLDQSESRVQSTVVLLDNPDAQSMAGLLGASFSESTGLGDDVMGGDPNVYSPAVDTSHSL